MKRTIRILTLAAALTLPMAAVPAHADTGLWSHTKTTAEHTWDKAKSGAGHAADWTAEKTKSGWDSTKHATADAAHWTKEKSHSGWDKTKAGAKHAAHWTADTAKKGWHATKAGAAKLWHKVTGDDSGK